MKSGEVGEQERGKLTSGESWAGAARTIARTPAD
jgi:hypothetical protein